MARIRWKKDSISSFGIRHTLYAEEEFRIENPGRVGTYWGESAYDIKVPPTRGKTLSFPSLQLEGREHYKDNAFFDSDQYERGLDHLDILDILDDRQVSAEPLTKGVEALELSAEMVRSSFHFNKLKEEEMWLTQTTSDKLADSDKLTNKDINAITDFLYNRCVPMSQHITTLSERIRLKKIVDYWAHFIRIETGRQLPYITLAGI